MKKPEPAATTQVAQEIKLASGNITAPNSDGMTNHASPSFSATGVTLMIAPDSSAISGAYKWRAKEIAQLLGHVLQLAALTSGRPAPPAC